MQAVLEIAELPGSGIEASASFMREHFSAAAQLIENPETTALAIVLPAAGEDHNDWRRAIARDMARAHAPRRVNVIGASGAGAAAPLLAYLRDAPGVTGQYLAAHD